MTAARDDTAFISFEPTASLIGPARASWDDQLAATLAAEREDGTT